MPAKGEIFLSFLRIEDQEPDADSKSDEVWDVGETSLVSARQPRHKNHRRQDNECPTKNPDKRCFLRMCHATPPSVYIIYTILYFVKYDSNLLL